jgi:hypothetical protein
MLSLLPETLQVGKYVYQGSVRSKSKESFKKGEDTRWAGA